MNIVYLPGAGSGSLFTSARMGYIYDTRAAYTGPSYIFAYNGDAIPHLTNIQGPSGLPETYTFNYFGNQTLVSPLTGNSLRECGVHAIRGPGWLGRFHQL
jgi:hypothetical protein